MVTQLSISVNEHKMLGKFLRLPMPRFSSIPSEDACKFFIAYLDRLQNLGLVKTYGVDYTTFKLDLAAQHFCRGSFDSKPTGSTSLTCT